jgi:antitoxin (DNA-binding transcriptional repressor) of toxin-antitoxin stability system
MKVEISSTQAVRQFGDCLARVKYRGDSFVITRNEERVAELVPVGGSTGVFGASWSEILDALSGLPTDPGFAEDLEQVNRKDLPPANPWA